MFYSVVHILLLFMKNNSKTLLYSSHLELYNNIYYTHIMFIISVLIIKFYHLMQINYIYLSLFYHAKMMIC